MQKSKIDPKVIEAVDRVISYNFYKKDLKEHYPEILEQLIYELAEGRVNFTDMEGNPV